MSTLLLLDRAVSSSAIVAFEVTIMPEVLYWTVTSFAEGSSEKSMVVVIFGLIHEKAIAFISCVLDRRC